MTEPESPRPENPETYEAAAAFGIDASSPGRPAWIDHLDAAKSAEKKARGSVVTHAASVAVRARDFALHLGLGAEAAERLRVALVWHDVGKIFTPDEILNFDGIHSPEQREVMKRHAADGADHLESVEGMPAEFGMLARHHHERYDGKGYGGLKGEEIPYLARIAQICDVCDALTEPRVYRPDQKSNRSADVVLDIMVEGHVASCEFDPFLLREFVRFKLDTELSQRPDLDLSKLRTFAASDPMTEIRHLGADAGVSIMANGTRTLFDRTEDGRPVVRAVVDKAGNEVGPVPLRPHLVTNRVEGPG